MKKLILLFFLLLAGCGPTPEPSILEKSSCKLPCWHGIIVGKTTKQELLDILNDIQIVNQDSITITRSVVLFDEWVYFTMGQGPRYFTHEEGNTVELDYIWTGQINILNDSVSRIVFSGDLGLTLKQLVDIFGMPTYAIPFYSRGENIRVELINPSRGVTFSFKADNFDSQINPDTKIDVLTIFDVALYDEMLENNQFMFSTDINSNDLERYVWIGYGKISLYWYTR